MEEKNNNISLDDINNCSSLTPNDKRIAELYFIQNKSLEEIVAEFKKEGSIQVASVERVVQYIHRAEIKIRHYKVKYDIDSNTVYREIAKKALMSWNGLSEEEATKFVMKSSNEELESQIFAQGSIDYALEGMQNWSNNRRGYRLIGVGDIEEIKFAIMNSSRSSNLFGRFKESNLWPGHDYDGKLKTELALSVLTNIHNGWVRDNQKKFMARDKKYQHMPIELIGWKEVKSDLIFLSPILDSMGIMPSEQKLEKAYNERVQAFLEEKGITDVSELIEQISRGADFYPALEGQDDITQALQDTEFVKQQVVSGIRDKGIGTTKQFAQQLFGEKTIGDADELEKLRAQKQALVEQEKTISEAEKLIEAKENQGLNLDE